MDVDKILKAMVRYVSGYVAAFVLCASSPRLHFKPRLVGDSGEALELTPSGGAPIREIIDPQLFGFAVVSLLIGTTLFTVFTAGAPTEESLSFVVTAVLNLVGWLVLASLAHLYCLVAGGRGRLVESLSLCTQVLAMLFVMTSIVTIVVGLIWSDPGGYDPYWGHHYPPVVENVLLGAPVLGAIAYLPPGLRAIHGISWVRAWIVTLIAIVPAQALAYAVLGLTNGLVRFPMG